MKNKKNILLGGSKNPVGYCKLHNKTLSTNQLKAKECLKKCCHHLIKNEEHQYWQERERKKIDKNMSRTSSKDLDAIKSVYDKGMKIKDICKLFNLSEETINKYLGISEEKPQGISMQQIRNELYGYSVSMINDIEELLDKKLGKNADNPILTLKALGYIEDGSKEGTFYYKENGRPKKRITISKTNRIIGYSTFDEYKNCYSTPSFIDFRTIEAIYSYGCDIGWNGVK